VAWCSQRDVADWAPGGLRSGGPGFMEMSLAGVVVAGDNGGTAIAAGSPAPRSPPQRQGAR
jgi:hypothetical protein